METSECKHSGPPEIASIRLRVSEVIRNLGDSCEALGYEVKGFIGRLLKPGCVYCWGASSPPDMSEDVQPQACMSSSPKHVGYSSQHLETLNPELNPTP